MKLDTGQDKAELGFQTPEAGTYTFEVTEGIELWTNENSGKTSLKIPTKIVETVDGDEDSVGMTVVHFAPIQTKFGEKQVASILTITGLAPAFEERFPDDTAFTDQRFVDALKLKLPGKLFIGEIEIRQNNKGVKNANFRSWEKLAKKSAAASAPKVAAPATADEDW